jgi:hypothetical protein
MKQALGRVFSTRILNYQTVVLLLTVPATASTQVAARTTDNRLIDDIMTEYEVEGEEREFRERRVNL